MRDAVRGAGAVGSQGEAYEFATGAGAVRDQRYWLGYLEGKFVVVRELERLMELVGRREEVHLFGCLQKEVVAVG